LSAIFRLIEAHRNEIRAQPASFAANRSGCSPRGGKKTFNARAEEIDIKPAFRAAFRQRRCLMPLDNFYEWKKTPAGKQPYAIGLAGGRLMAMAGLW
jgi:putative SOS response-associated peptidase YedK